MLRLARRLGAVFLALCVGVAGGAPVAAAAAAKAAAKDAALEAQMAQLDSLRRQCAAAAHALQEREHAVSAIDLAVNVMRTGVEQKGKEIAQSRKEQEKLLGALQRLARAPPEALAFAPEGPVERLRSGILIAAAVPALAAQARDLTGQLASLTAVRRQIDGSKSSVDAARAALQKSRDALAQLVAQRNGLDAKLAHDGGKQEPVKPGDASDLFDLIKRADAAIDERDKALLPHLRKLYGAALKGAPSLDPTRPKTLHALDEANAQMVWPVLGDITHHARETDTNGKPRVGTTLAALPKAVVVAPFDGRVVYAGPYRDFGLILIIGHGGDYHSMLAGLGRTDVVAGQWVLAGEPVASLTDGDAAGASLYIELRRGGYPVDPEPRFASSGEKTEETRVR